MCPEPFDKLWTAPVEGPHENLGALSLAKSTHVNVFVRLPQTLARSTGCGTAIHDRRLAAQGNWIATGKDVSGDIMSGMEISSHLDFAAPPAEVYTMLTDKRYLEEVCVASGSISHHVSVTGSTTQTSRTLPAPESAARFTGPQLTVNDEIVWEEPSSDGSRSGTVTMTVLGQPVTFKGGIRLAPGGRGSEVDVQGNLKVAIPLLGRKLEESAAPAVMAGYRKQQEVGDKWLAGASSSRESEDA